ncbi:MAG: B12-binding domain-containing protein [Tsuneonella sp.]
MAAAVSVPNICPENLSHLERHYIAPDIYRRDDVAERQEKLARIVSNEIVPLLLMLHSEVVPDAPPAVLVEALLPSRADVGGLAEIVLGSDLAAAVAYVAVLRDRGLSMETLFVELLEPTARYLGDMWEQDKCDFIDVTLGVARLQQLLAFYSDTHIVPALGERRSVLIAMTPGNEHSFGLAMVERFLLAAGWQVQPKLSGTAEDIAAAAHETWFAVVGLTMGSERQIESLRSTIAQLRDRSRNPDIGVMVGGPLFTADPALAREVGADATAPNAPAAVLVAQKLFNLAVAKGGPRVVAVR